MGEISAQKRMCAGNLELTRNIVLLVTTSCERQTSLIAPTRVKW